MNADDEKLLQQLGRFARTSERAPQQVQLDKLSSGELSEHELKALSDAAADDAALQRALVAYEPLPSAATAQIAERVLATVRARASEDVEGESSDQDDVGEEPYPASGNVVPLHAPARRAGSRAMRALWIGVPLCAAAAALMLWLGTKHEPLAALPVYQLEVSGGQAEVRSGPSTVKVDGESTAPVRVGRTTRLHLVLRPQTTAASAVGARVFLLATTHAPIDWPAQIERAPSGALQLVLTAPPAAIGAADSALVVVGDAARIDTPGADLAVEQAGHDQTLQRWRIALLPGSAD